MITFGFLTCLLIQSEQYIRYIASKKRPRTTELESSCAPTKTGIPVEFVFLPGSASDVRAPSCITVEFAAGKLCIRRLCLY